MFDVRCPRCGSRRLVPLSRITALRKTDRGIHGVGPMPSPRRTVGRLRRTVRRFAAAVSAAHAGRVPF